MTTSQFEETLKRLSAEFGQSLESRLKDILEDWEQFECADDLSARQNAAGTVQHKVHHLVGGGATFGFETISEIARPLDNWLRDYNRGDGDLVPSELCEMRQQMKRLEVAIQDSISDE